MDPTTAEPPTGPKPPEAEAAKAKRASSSKGPSVGLRDWGGAPFGGRTGALPPSFNPTALPPCLPAWRPPHSIAYHIHTYPSPHPSPHTTDAKPKKEKSKDKEKGESNAKDKSKDKTKDKTKSSKSRRGSSSSTGAPADEAATATAPRREKPPAGEATAAATAGAVAMAPAPAPGLTRTLSFHGGLAVAEALHAELATGVRLLVQDEEDPNGGLTLQAPGVISREERGSPRSPLGGSGKLPRPTVMGDACHATLSLYPVLTGAGSNQQRCGFLEAVVDAGPTRRLEKAGAVNWHADCPYLVALKVRERTNRTGFRGSRR